MPLYNKWPLKRKSFSRGKVKWNPIIAATLTPLFLAPFIFSF